MVLMLSGLGQKEGDLIRCVAYLVIMSSFRVNCAAHNKRQLGSASSVLQPWECANDSQ